MRTMLVVGLCGLLVGCGGARPMVLDGAAPTSSAGVLAAPTAGSGAAGVPQATPQATPQSAPVMNLAPVGTVPPREVELAPGALNLGMPGALPLADPAEVVPTVAPGWRMEDGQWRRTPTPAPQPAVAP